MYSVNYKAREAAAVSAAIYVRLSDEDIDKCGNIDSQSIINQKGMLTSFCESRKWAVYGVYCDDGITGLEKNRPEFKRLLADCESGKVNTVIVKEQSRFCRNTSLVDEILKEKFPMWGIHFIAVTTGLDSDDPDYLNRISLNGYIDESYIEATSKRVTSVFKYKRAIGECICPFAAYGYVKDPADKHHLIVDEEVRSVVVRIFEEYASGIGMGKIARGLNDDGIPSPYEYKKLKGSKFNAPNNKTGLWRDRSVQGIISNEVYIGNLAQGRRRKINYRVKKAVNLPPEEWTRVENTHEAIISRELWDKAQARKAEKHRASCRSETVYCLAGKCICGVCGATMRKHTTYGKYPSGEHKGERNGVVYESMFCGSHNSGNIMCDNTATIRSNLIIQECMKAINNAVAAYTNGDNIAIDDHCSERLNELNMQLKQLTEKAEKTQKRLDNMYKDKLDGTITADEYMRYKVSFSAELDDIHKNIIKIEKSIRTLENSRLDMENRQQLIEKYRNITEFTREVADDFIESIVIGRLEKDGSRDMKINLKI